MSTLNGLTCSEDVKNTGFGTCTLEFGAIVGAFIMPVAMSFTEAQVADLQNTLKAAALADKPNRIYPIHGFEAITDNTQDPTFQTMASGRPVFIREGSYDWTMQFIDGGLCLSNMLRSFNSGNWAALFYDQQGTLFGYKKTDIVTGLSTLNGVPLDTLYTYPWKANDFSNTAHYRIKFSFKPVYINEAIGFATADFPLQEIQGIKDVKLKKLSTIAAGVVSIGANVSCGGDDMHALYATELSSGTLWQAKNKETGAPISITTVANNTALGGWTVTLSTVDPDYPLSTHSLLLSWVSASALSVGGVQGYESIPLEIKIP